MSKQADDYARGGRVVQLQMPQWSESSARSGTMQACPMKSFLLPACAVRW